MYLFVFDYSNNSNNLNIFCLHTRVPHVHTMYAPTFTSTFPPLLFIDFDHLFFNQFNHHTAICSIIPSLGVSLLFCSYKVLYTYKYLRNILICNFDPGDIFKVRSSSIWEKVSNSTTYLY